MGYDMHINYEGDPKGDINVAQTILFQFTVTPRILNRHADTAPNTMIHNITTMAR